ncbi:HAD family hydrolase [Cuneatibacter sp. NSJ-177]|uniref:HAD family hydrolase n=1 Tax=Cuneatibacter sp. NSJ-177 TaxID=2931401 RepID=UPI001FD2C377|nr:HAD family hydrolase [Cuneatibacter sp. NSJ-177]MCJ7836377.1 HAD family hydrolase [Cuneatibacter sp. NSJ-177]
MNFRYLLFDLDGTLTDPKEGITKSVQYALKAMGVDEPDLDRLTCFIGPPLIDSFMEYYEFTREQAKIALARYRERFQGTGIFENRVLPGIPEMLEKLKSSGKVLALATSKPEPFARKILEKFGLLGYFDEVVGSGMDESRCTKEEVIQEVFLRLGLSEEQKKQALMIGDRKHDIVGAKACGIASLGVRIGYAEEGELEAAGADFVKDTVKDMEAFLLEA